MAFTFQREAFDPATLALAQFFAQMGQRNREDQASKQDEENYRSRLSFETQKKKELYDYEQSDKERLMAEMAAALEQMYPQNRPDVPVDSTLPTQQLGDLSGMAGVAGQMSPEDAASRAAAGPNMAPLPTQAGPGITGDIGETRKMTQEEVLPQMFQRLLAKGASTEDLQRLSQLLVSRNDYNIAKGEGLGGEATASPFQEASAASVDSDLAYQKAQTANLNASAEKKGGSGDEVDAWTEKLANGEIHIDQIPRFPPELKSAVVARMKDNNWAIIAPKVREQVAGVHKTNKLLDLFEEKWQRVEDAYRDGGPVAGKIKAALAYDDFEKAINGNAAQFRKAVGESGAFTQADADKMINLMSIGKTQALADLVQSNMGDGKGAFTGRARKRLADTRESFTAGLDAQVRNYYGLLGEDGKGLVEMGGLPTKGRDKPAVDGASKNTGGGARGTVNDFDMWLANKTGSTPGNQP